MDMVVGRIGRPHGIRGGVTVQVRTDDPEARFAVGSVLGTDPAAVGPLTVAASSRSGGVLVLAFDGIGDRSAAERLRGTLLTIDAAALPSPEDDDEFYDHELIGLSARHVNGSELGEVTGVLHPPAAPVLQVRTAAGEVLVPFVAAIVPRVDVAGGTIEVDPPDGMFAADGG